MNNNTKSDIPKSSVKFNYTAMQVTVSLSTLDLDRNFSGCSFKSISKPGIVLRYSQNMPLLDSVSIVKPILLDESGAEKVD